MWLSRGDLDESALGRLKYTKDVDCIVTNGNQTFHGEHARECKEVKI